MREICPLHFGADSREGRKRASSLEFSEKKRRERGRRRDRDFIAIYAVGMRKSRVALTTRRNKYVFKCRCLNGEIRRTARTRMRARLGEAERIARPNYFYISRQFAAFVTRCNRPYAIASRHIDLIDFAKLHVAMK